MVKKIKFRVIYVGEQKSLVVIFMSNAKNVKNIFVESIFLKKINKSIKVIKEIIMYVNQVNVKKSLLNQKLKKINKKDDKRKKNNNKNYNN